MPLSVLWLWLGLELGVGAGPQILHEPLECIAPGDYPVIQASIAPSADVRTAKVYFRSEKYLKFYYVAMTASPTGFEVVLPRPSLETQRIVYYIEAVDLTFSNTVGVEHVLEIRADCREEPKIAAAEEPEIIVGATEAGAAATPPGFETVGIIGTVTSAGISTALGGGTGVGTAVAVGGVAAGVGGGVVAVSSISSEEPPPEEPPEEPTGSAPEPGPAAPSPGPAPPTPAPTSEPTPTPPPEQPPEEPPETPPAPTPTPTPPPAPVSACFTFSVPGGSCNLKLDAGCSTGTITNYDWVIDPGAAYGGPTMPVGIRVNRTFPQCDGQTVSVKLTVSSSTDSDSVTQFVTMPVSVALREPSPSTLSCRVTSELVTAKRDGSTRAALSGAGLGRLVHLDDTAPVELALALGASTEESWIEGTVLTPAQGLWRFDFERCEALVPGSLRADGPADQSGDGLVFHLTGGSGEQIRFRFRLAR